LEADDQRHGGISDITSAPAINEASLLIPLWYGLGAVRCLFSSGESGKEATSMYGSGRGLGFISGAGGLGAGLALTGFRMVGLVLVGLALVLLGLALVRLGPARRR